MILRIIGAALIAVSSFSAAAVVINANDFAIGADFSNPDSNTTLTWINNYGYLTGSGTQFLPVVVGANTIEKNLNQFGSSSIYSGGTDSLRHLRGVAPNGLNSLGDSEFFESLLISYLTPTRQFSIKAVEYSSDGVLAFAFDKNGNYIPNPYKTVSSLDWRVAEPYFGHAYDRTITYYFDTDVYSILFGGEDTETYIYEINTSLPEPGTIVLMFVGFLGLMVRARAKRQLRSN